MDIIKPYYIYIFFRENVLISNQTYNGSTNNLIRRLRQHNGEITGGAKATKGKGPWNYLVIIDGFGTHNEALSCEWKIKHPTGTKKRPIKYCGKNGRIESLNLVMSIDNWTKNCVGLGSGKEYTIYILDEYIHLIDKEKIKSVVKKSKVKDLNRVNLNVTMKEKKINFC